MTTYDWRHDENAQSDRSLAAILLRLRLISTRIDVASSVESSIDEEREAIADPAPGRWRLCDWFACDEGRFVIARFHASPAPSRPRVGLSWRERAIVARVASGAPLKVVAFHEALSVQAVSTYLARAQRKLGVTSHADLIWSLNVDATAAAQYDFDGEHFRVIKLAAGPLGGLHSELTAAEQDVLSGIVQGLAYAEIARRRATSVRTVNVHATSVMRKVGVTSRWELIALAVGRRPSL
jgi:DNA-binding NarL/FixJ family response regulator